MGTFLDLLSDSSSVACFIARMQSTAIVPVTAAPKIAPTKNDFKGDIVNLGNNLLRWFDMSDYRWPDSWWSQGWISDPLPLPLVFHVDYGESSSYHYSIDAISMLDRWLFVWREASQLRLTNRLRRSLGSCQWACASEYWFPTNVFLRRNIHHKILANDKKSKSFIFHTEMGLDYHVTL